MSDAVLTTLISSGFVLIGTIITALVSIKSGKTVKNSATTIDAVEKKLDAHIKEDEWAQAKQYRIRILRFNDEICAGVRYSENHYEEVLDDIDAYEAFCDRHPDYHNNKGTLAMNHIKDDYSRRKKDNNFLGGQKHDNI